MAQLDQSATSTVAQFAADMGIGEIASVDGAFSFDVETSGRLSVLGAEDGRAIIVSLTRKIMLTDLVGYGRLLSVAGMHPVRERMIRAGVTAAGQPVLAVSGPRTGFDRSRLETEFTILREAFQEAGL